MQWERVSVVFEQPYAGTGRPRRRCVTRYEYHLENFAGFVKLAAMIMLLRQF